MREGGDKEKTVGDMVVKRVNWGNGNSRVKSCWNTDLHVGSRRTHPTKKVLGGNTMEKRRATDAWGEIMLGVETKRTSLSSTRGIPNPSQGQNKNKNESKLLRGGTKSQRICKASTNWGVKGEIAN